MLAGSLVCLYTLNLPGLLPYTAHYSWIIYSRLIYLIEVNISLDPSGGIGCMLLAICIWLKSQENDFITCTMHSSEVQ